MRGVTYTTLIIAGKFAVDGLAWAKQWPRTTLEAHHVPCILEGVEVIRSILAVIKGPWPFTLWLDSQIMVTDKRGLGQVNSRFFMTSSTICITL